MRPTEGYLYLSELFRNKTTYSPQNSDIYSGDFARWKETNMQTENNMGSINVEGWGFCCIVFLRSNFLQTKTLYERINVWQPNGWYIHTPFYTAKEKNNPVEEKIRQAKNLEIAGVMQSFGMFSLCVFCFFRACSLLLFCQPVSSHQRVRVEYSKKTTNIF